MVMSWYDVQRILAKCMSSFSRSFGPLITAFGMGMVGYVSFVFLYEPVIPKDAHIANRVGLTLFGLWLLFNIYFNWIMVLRTDPGLPPKTLTTTYAKKACKKCDRPKPARTHHCSVCNRCVLAMDHHCPWMNNCIGFYNYRYFVLFLIYLWVGCLFVVIVFFCYYPIIAEIGIADGGIQIQSMSQASLFSFLLSFSMIFAVSLLLGFHLYLVLRAYTTIEYYSSLQIARPYSRHPFMNKYDIGLTRNWESVFGKNKYYLQWMLPSTRRRTGNGYVWPTCKSILLEKQNQIV